MTDTILAIDLGTSSTKLLLVSRDGEILARQRLPHRTHRPETGAAEQDPAEWRSNLVSGVGAIRATIPADVRLAGIGVTGQMHGLIVHDASGNVLRRAITWEDRRSTDPLRSWLDRLPDHPPVAPGFQAASWLWLREAEPDIAARASHLLLPKDEIIYRLTGHRLTDPSDAIGTGWYRAGEESWDAKAIGVARVRAGMLPEIVPSGSIAGSLTVDAAATLGLEPGIPVVIAGGDAAVAAFGAGAIDDGTPLVVLSTGCQALQPTASMPGRNAWPSANPPGLARWLRVATTLNGGNVVEWARETFGEPDAHHDPELLFLPYLAGEREGSPGEGASGAFIGLHSTHHRHNMSRAAFDGVALALADAFEASGGEIGTTAPVLAGGGGTRDGAWLQSVADALCRSIAAIDEADLSAWGAARSTATALRWIDPAATPATWRPMTRTVSPGTTPDTARARLDRFRTLACRVFASEAQ